MNTLIVDDEPLARARIKRLLEKHHNITVLGEAADGQEALRLCQQLKPDLVLLDINIPVLTGLQVAEQLNLMAVPPAIVFLTAHPEYAINAFQLAVGGYLVKPVSEQALANTLSQLGKLNRVHIEKQQPAYIRYQLGNTIRRIALAEVFYCMAEEKYTHIYHTGGDAIIEHSLKSLAQHYPSTFMRIHRKIIVNRSRLECLSTANGLHYLKLRDCEALLPISRREFKTVKLALSSIS
ncbi:LytR/AlgR family response regulator transcription factor [Pseudoalteromonas mariniglutinosa]|uniref:LytR/AlgR family response regulator transcription factor n=1 Tax=Pseudoalteromonas mariniglutinosa TaxID=206042 RepID=UPI00384C7B33